MNYYEHHIGDYAEATSHLSFVEDAAYSRLLRKYYASERPLPVDVKSVQRLVGARSREEKKAVDDMLAEFFILQADGWHNSRCDEEIERFTLGAPERKTRKANEELRLKRHREERTRLFLALHAVDQSPAWNAPIAVLRSLHAQFCATAETGPATPQTSLATNGNALHATGPATPATATQAARTAVTC